MRTEGEVSREIARCFPMKEGRVLLEEKSFVDVEGEGSILDSAREVKRRRRMATPRREIIGMEYKADQKDESRSRVLRSIIEPA